MDEYEQANRKHWDEVVAIHAASASYDVAGFKAGRRGLHQAELEEVGDVRGKSLLHLQCHFGLDTLSWARLGARVTGIDFSGEGIAQARSLAAECGIEATFVESAVETLPDVLSGQFDIVFTSYGAIYWLPDLQRWGEVIAHFLRPGGTFYVAEFHPFTWVFDDAPDVTELRLRYPYFDPGTPLRFDEDGTYADRSARLQHRTTFAWIHSMGDIVNALTSNGLQVEFLHEFPWTVSQVFPFQESTDGRLYRIPERYGQIPGTFSIRAKKA